MFSGMSHDLSWLAHTNDPERQPKPKTEKVSDIPAAESEIPRPARSLAQPTEVPKNKVGADIAESTAAFQLEVPPELAMLRRIAEEEGATLGDRDFVMLTSSTLLAPMEKNERVLRTTFVQEYLFDFDATAAACRCGYSDERFGLAPSDAELAARKLMAEPVVRRLIKEYALTQAQELTEQQIRFLVMREAANHSVTGSPAARQASQKLLVELTKKNPTGDEGTVKGGIMAVPARFASDSDWERRALDSQQKLKESVGA